MGIARISKKCPKCDMLIWGKDVKDVEALLHVHNKYSCKESQHRALVEQMRRGENADIESKPV